MQKKAYIRKTILLIILIIVTSVHLRAQQRLFYFLVDFSSSQDSTQKAIINQISQACEYLPEEDSLTIKVFRIAKDNSPTPLMTLDLPGIKTSLLLKKRFAQSERDTQLKKMSQVLALAFLKYRGDISYIQKTIENASYNLENANFYKSRQLVIFSDMLEVSYYRGEHFNFEKKNGATKGLTWLSTKFNPVTPLFANMPDLTITIFSTSATSKVDPDDTWRDFWHLWFKKQGYKKSVPIVTDVQPRWYQH
jgi:hypothetical protein